MRRLRLLASGTMLASALIAPNSARSVDCTRNGQPTSAPAQPQDPDPCEHCQSDCNGLLLVYNPDNGRTLSADVLAMKNEATAQGAPPISCIRPQHCQDQLVKCFNECGQEGRASKVSLHTDGSACDWSRKDAAVTQRLRERYPSIGELAHGGPCGSGLHNSTKQYQPSPRDPHPLTWDSK